MWSGIDSKKSKKKKKAHDFRGKMRNWLHKLRLAACCFPGRSPLPSHGTIFYLESLINCFISCFDLLWQEGWARPQTNLTARHEYGSNAAFSQLELKKVWSCHGWQQILMTEVHVIAITLPYRRVVSLTQHPSRRDVSSTSFHPGASPSICHEARICPVLMKTINSPEEIMFSAACLFNDWLVCQRDYTKTT